MQKNLTRREFLKLGALGIGSLALSPPSLRSEQALIGRVAYESVSVFDQPKLNANTLGYRFRDALLNVYYPVTPLTGPAYNPLWYRISGGYVHSALIQPVWIQYNEPMTLLPPDGKLTRVTVPFTRPYNYSRQSGWQPEPQYLLYHHSNHWVTDIVEGPSGEPWYQITESWENVQYYAEATHLQAVSEDEITPVSSTASPAEKRIEISLAQQSLTAYEGDQIVLRTSISSGVRNSGLGGLPTETPKGTFSIYAKLPAKYMGDDRLTDNLGDRFLPGVPWTMFFAEGGYAIHGAYWHNNFGAPMSRGCVNVRPEEALWLYRWVTPIIDPNEWEATGNGTRVIVK